MRGLGGAPAFPAELSSLASMELSQIDPQTMDPRVGLICAARRDEREAAQMLAAHEAAGVGAGAAFSPSSFGSAASVNASSRLLSARHAMHPAGAYAQGFLTLEEEEAALAAEEAELDALEAAEAKAAETAAAEAKAAEAKAAEAKAAEANGAEPKATARLQESGAEVASQPALAPAAPAPVAPGPAKGARLKQLAAQAIQMARASEASDGGRTVSSTLAGQQKAPPSPNQAGGGGGSASGIDQPGATPALLRRMPSCGVPPPPLPLLVGASPARAAAPSGPRSFQDLLHPQPASSASPPLATVAPPHTTRHAESAAAVAPPPPPPPPPQRMTPNDEPSLPRGLPRAAFEDRLANLTRRFPSHAEGDVWRALLAANGHAGMAAKALDAKANDAKAEQARADALRSTGPVVATAAPVDLLTHDRSTASLLLPRDATAHQKRLLERHAPPGSHFHALLHAAVSRGDTDAASVMRMLEHVEGGRFSVQHYTSMWEQRLRGVVSSAGGAREIREGAPAPPPEASLEAPSPLAAAQGHHLDRPVPAEPGEVPGLPEHCQALNELELAAVTKQTGTIITVNLVAPAPALMAPAQAQAVVSAPAGDDATFAAGTDSTSCCHSSSGPSPDETSTAHPSDTGPPPAPPGV